MELSWLERIGRSASSAPLVIGIVSAVLCMLGVGVLLIRRSRLSRGPAADVQPDHNIVKWRREGADKQDGANRVQKQARGEARREGGRAPAEKANPKFAAGGTSAAAKSSGRRRHSRRAGQGGRVVGHAVAQETRLCRP